MTVMTKNPYIEICEFGAYVAAALFAWNRYVSHRRKVAVGVQRIRKTITINAGPELIRPYLEQADQDLEFEFKPAPEGRGTEVTVFSASESVRKMLRAIKMKVETGEIATVAGQTHGAPLKSSIGAQLEHAVYRLVNRRELKNATEGQCKRFAGTESTN